jgi:cyclin B
VGVTALFIACKYEEIYPPEVKDCVYITDHAYTREEVLEMEMKMLRFFEYNISVPTCYQFLVRFLRIAGYNTSSRVAYRASYFSERCLQEHEMLSYKPSLIAVSPTKEMLGMLTFTAPNLPYICYRELSINECRRA